MTKYYSEQGTLSKSIHSGKWMAMGIVIRKGISLITFFILARFLTPADYGIIAAVLIVTAVVERFSEHSLTSAMAQKKIDMEPYLDTVWTINVLKSFILALIIFLLAPFLSSFFNIEQTVNVFRLAGIFIILPNLSNIRQIYFFTELNFKSIFLRDVAAQLAYSIVAIASIFFISVSFWALFLGQCASMLTALLITYWLYPSSPAFSFKFKQLWPFVKYSKWMTAQQILTYLASFMDKLFIGRFLAVDMLGFYTKARDLSSLTTSSITSMINKIGFFAYNNIQSDIKKIQEGFVKSLDLILIISLPFCFLLLVEGGAIISVLLGSKWLFLVLPLKILAIGNIFNALVSLTYPIINSLGRPEINFRIIFFRLIISVPLFYYGIIWNDLVGVSWAAVIANVLVLLYAIFESRKLINLKLKDISLSFSHILASLLPVVFLSLTLRNFIHSFQNNLVIFFWVLFLAVLYSLGIIVVGHFFSGGPRDTLLIITKELRVNLKK